MIAAPGITVCLMIRAEHCEDPLYLRSKMFAKFLVPDPMDRLLFYISPPFRYLSRAFWQRSVELS